MFGGIKEGNATPVAECNAYADPLAVDILLKSKLKIYMAPLDVMDSINIPVDYIDRLQKLPKSQFLDVTI